MEEFGLLACYIPPRRATAVDAAVAPSKPEVKIPRNPDLAKVDKLRGQLQDLVGWSADWNQFGFSTERKQNFDSGKFVELVGLHVPGWILSFVAVSLGAPFWFDA